MHDLKLPLLSIGVTLNHALCNLYNGLGSLECFVITKCTKFGQLILGKIIKIVATRCHILRLKCTKFDFGWGSAPHPARAAYSAPQTP